LITTQRGGAAQVRQERGAPRVRQPAARQRRIEDEGVWWNAWRVAGRRAASAYRGRGPHTSSASRPPSGATPTAVSPAARAEAHERLGLATGTAAELEGRRGVDAAVRNATCGA
jgi:hypothetical protein